MCAVLLGCAGGEANTICESTPGMEVFCGFQNPEDLALSPDGKTLIVSQAARTDGTGGGGLVAFTPESGGPTPLFPLENATPGPGDWGSAQCPGPPGTAFSPHGINLGRGPDGSWMLLAVNHGGRESIEFFEVLPSSEKLALRWRGCVPAPEGANLNDVLILPEGGFLTTHMFPASGTAGTALQILRMIAFETKLGRVLEWQPETGFSDVPGTEASFPNGLEISDDGSTLYLNVYMGDEVRAIRLDTGETVFSAEVESPDNATWSSDGRLLVASHPGSFLETLACTSIESGSCIRPFQIVAIDAETGISEVVIDSDGTPMGAGTVALQVGDDVWIGSFIGDRIGRAPLPH
ncbi:MAG: hypothetical protein QF890_04175 [Myxococcota bacterium]|nr:hypothetical protein [Deltaproteobacteria bacterium]MCP4240135.1 hypothetical protein [bacterium]MDP6076156.1 hypothetical protein [Myxococcota bacterium]MDP6243087.1 hypothetical protein [Myxococcota bacterium]MDP7073496.1 hypothetical protein [Myxococcota bacterium]